MTRRQHYLFAHKHLQKIFYQQPYRIFEHLRSDMASIHLVRYWQDTAEDFGIENQDIVDPVGLKIDYSEKSEYGLIIISLPSPKISPEAYFIGMWANYSDRYKGESFRYFVLELEEDVSSQKNSLATGSIPVFCEWTTDGEHVNYGCSKGSSLNNFVEAIEDLVSSKQSSTINNLDNNSQIARPAHVSYMPKSPTLERSATAHDFFSEEFEKLINLPKKQPAISIDMSALSENNKNIMTKRQSNSIQDLHLIGHSNGHELNMEIKNQGQRSAFSLFEGVFKPPIISIQKPPIKIAGLGCCEAMPDGLRVQGFKQTPRFSSSQLAIVFLVLYISGKLIGGILGWLLVVPALLLLYSAAKGQGTDHKGEEIKLLIPWENISNAKLDKISGAVIIHVKSFRNQGERYKGSLFFHPSIKPQSLLDALQIHNVKCKH